MSTFMGMNLNLTPNSNITGNMDCLTITTSFLEERRDYIYRIRGDGDDALCPKVAEVKFEPHLHFILKIDPPNRLLCVDVVL